MVLALALSLSRGKSVVGASTGRESHGPLARKGAGSLGAEYDSPVAGKIDAARPLAEEGLELWRETDDRLELALALESVGWSQYTKNDYVAALRLMEECVDLYRELGSEKLVTRGRVAVGQMLAALGDVERTEMLARE